MGSHSVTCHPTQVNAPHLTPAMQAGTRFTYPVGMEGWVDLVDLIAPQMGVELVIFRSQVWCPTTAPPRQPVVFLQNIITFTLCIIFNSKNPPTFEIRSTVYLLLLSAIAVVTSGKYIDHSLSEYYNNFTLVRNAEITGPGWLLRDTNTSCRHKIQIQFVIIFHSSAWECLFVWHETFAHNPPLHFQRKLKLFIHLKNTKTSWPVCLQSYTGITRHGDLIIVRHCRRTLQGEGRSVCIGGSV